MVWEEKIFNGFLLWSPWQLEFFIEHNYLKEFQRGPPKEHSFGKNPVNSFWGQVFWRKSLRTTWTHARTDGLTHDGHNAMTKARWPSASGAKNDAISNLFMEQNTSLLDSRIKIRQHFMQLDLDLHCPQRSEITPCSLTHYFIDTFFNASTTDSFWNHCEKRRNCS